MSDDKILLDKIKATLDRSVDQLDDKTEQRLMQARRAALVLHPHTSSVPKFRQQLWQRLSYPLGAFALTASAILVFMIWQGQLSPELNLNTAEDMELIAENDDFMMFEDLEFYQWLAETDEYAG